MAISLVTGFSVSVVTTLGVLQVRRIGKLDFLDEGRLLPCSALLEGEYGLKGVFCGVPVRLGRKGILEIVELKLTAEEKKALSQSASRVRQGVEELTPVLSS